MYSVEQVRRVRLDAQLQRARALRCRSTARRQREESIWLMWRARQLCFDHYGPVLAVWDSGAQDQPDMDASANGVDLERLVSRLFESGLAITACRALVDDEVASRLDSVIEMLDSMIRDARLAVFEAQGALASGLPGGGADDPPGSETIEISRRAAQGDGLVPILQKTSLTVEALWRLASDGDSGDSNESGAALGEASQSLHRAIIALEAARTAW